MWALNKNPADRPEDADELDRRARGGAGGDPGGSAGERTGEHGGASAAAARPLGRRSRCRRRTSCAADPRAGALPLPCDGDAPAYRSAGPVDEPPDESAGGRWPWVLGLLLVLLLAGGGVAAYLLTRPAQVVVPPVSASRLNRARRSSRTPASRSA